MTNKVHLGDSYQLIKTIPDNSVDLILTDPPYLIENTNSGKTNELGKSIQNMNDQLSNGKLTCGVNEDILNEFIRVCKKTNIYIWCNHKQIPMYLDFFVTKHKCNFDILVWNKPNATPLFHNKYLTDKEYCLYFRKGGYCNPQSYEDGKTVFTHPINIKDKELYNHPTIKPMNIIKTLIRNSTHENDVVLDCFSGSGTTCVACQETNRQFIGIEIDENYHKISVDRLNGISARDREYRDKGAISIFDIIEEQGDKK